MSAHVDLTKLAVSLAAIAGVVVLLAMGQLDQGAGVGLIGTVVGYILGNGRSVAAGDRPGTLLTRTDVRTRAADDPEAP